MATDIDFPSQLPTPLRSGYGLKPVATFARTKMASGRAKQRPMWRTVPTMVPVSFMLKESQAQIFEAWFNYGINYGNAWFNCKLDSPMGLKPYECRFTEMYDGPTLVGKRHWRYDAILEIFERPIFSEDWYLYGLEFIEYSKILDLAINREWPSA